MAVLGELEHKVMRVLWAGREPMSVRSVHEALETDRELAYTTVMTVLDRLAKKGVVTREQQGRAWLYLPVQTQAAMVADEMANLLDEAGDEGMRTVGEFMARLSPELAEHARLCLGVKPERR
ncbi:BlaI/MecI/CopY family transcriptional regulator [Aestuariimicrobium soli]|uniref:BlaI/MecI/CopY family transcriptional regulator n=1 Tax=Aestuariimicrobium soli TaxID=2035834 RepID=UPI003EB71689